MRPYSTDLRKRIINAVRHDANTPEETATRFDVSRSTVYNYLQFERDRPNPQPLKSTGRQRRIPLELEPELHTQILNHPDDTLAMHCTRWKRLTGTTISLTCMHNSILRLGITLKKNALRQ